MLRQENIGGQIEFINVRYVDVIQMNFTYGEGHQLADIQSSYAPVISLTVIYTMNYKTRFGIVGTKSIPRDI